MPLTRFGSTTLQQICGRAAHELKGALNGASVNLEVVRSRSTKPDAAGISGANVRHRRGKQLDERDRRCRMHLLVLARVARSPVELGLVDVAIDRVAEALGARKRTRSLELAGSFEDLGATSADANAVRVVVGGTLLLSVDGDRSPAPSFTMHRARPAGPGAAGRLRIESWLDWRRRCRPPRLTLFAVGGRRGRHSCCGGTIRHFHQLPSLGEGGPPRYEASKRKSSHRR